ncbi:MAG: hypothetical protein ACJKSS_02350 [Patescibacteria group bacterium UBA2103]
MNKLFAETVGWYGAGAILLAYTLVSFSVLEATSIWYQLLNLTGAAGIAIISFCDRSSQPGILNSIWALVALVALINIVL